MVHRDHVLVLVCGALSWWHASVFVLHMYSTYIDALVDDSCNELVEHVSGITPTSFVAMAYW